MSRYDYTLIRSNRKSYSIKITEDNRIIVRAPLSASVRSVENLLIQKSGWIEKYLAFNSGNSFALPEVSSYEKAYVGGELYPVYRSGRNYIDSFGVHATSVRGFRNAYVGSLGQEFLRAFSDLQTACRLKAASVSFRSYKSRWGCCDGKNNICFNFKLLMLPPDLQRYVMVHELCHTVRHDHSDKFWSLVSTFEPRFRELRKRLKDYVFLVKLYC